MRKSPLRSLALIAFVASALPSASRAQDAAAGEKVFKMQCAVCHSPLAGKKLIGPSLFGVVGRLAGTVADFKYTEANQHSGLTWDAATLDRYLRAPREVVPGTAMTYAGLKTDQQRTDLIAFLATLK